MEKINIKKKIFYSHKKKFMITKNDWMKNYV